MEEDKNELKEEFKKEFEKEFNHNCKCDSKNNNRNYVSGSNCVYGMGFIGAAIYFISTAATFWIGALGILKALVWPAIIVYELLKFFVK